MGKSTLAANIVYLLCVIPALFAADVLWVMIGVGIGLLIINGVELTDGLVEAHDRRVQQSHWRQLRGGHGDATLLPNPNTEPLAMFHYELGERIRVCGITRDGETGTTRTGSIIDSFYIRAGSGELVPTYTVRDDQPTKNTNYHSNYQYGEGEIVATLGPL